MTHLTVLPEWVRAPMRMPSIPETRAVSLDAARNEMCALQIQIVPAAPCRITIAGGDYWKQGGTEGEVLIHDSDPRWRWYEELPITVAPVRAGIPRLGAGTYYDGLRPVGDGIDSTGQVAIWVDLKAPDVAGDYTAELLIRVGDERLSVAVSLHVHDFAIGTPSIPFSTIINPSKLDAHDGPWRTRYPAYMALAREHGLNAMLPGWASLLTSRPEAWRSTPWMTGAVPAPGAYGAGLLWRYDEPAIKSYVNWPSECISYYREVKSLYPSVSVLLTEGTSADAFAACDVLASKADRCIPTPGRRQWAYQSYDGGLPLNTVDRLSPGLRAWPWIAKRYGLEGMLTWCMNFWSDDPRVVPDPQYGDGNGVLCYPGALASIRLKECRRGMQDLAIMEAAERTGHGLQVMAMYSNLVPRALSDGNGWSRVPADYDGMVGRLRTMAEWGMGR